MPHANTGKCGAKHTEKIVGGGEELLSKERLFDAPGVEEVEIEIEYY